MKRTRKQYDRHFKENAVKLSFERQNVSATARELGVDVKMLRRWKSEYEQFKEASFQGQGVPRLTEDQKELHRLRESLRKRNLEIEILKKALGIISTSDR
ncbi:MAG: transposase [Bacteroidales bacterium]|jgi:transposase|nr:transposase [Bacteroidales bacterium]